ncbi:MAG TPA: hypothetical protein VJV78_05450 [Polyangiales bacterium]|nr:hypothetical protein [Polyangiales bacterium]
MYEGTRGAVSLALISLSVWGCTQHGAPGHKEPAYIQEYLDAADAAEPDATDPDAGEPVPNCASHDQTCDAVDDDCDGKLDEDFQALCVFGSVAITCVDGATVSERCDDSNVCTQDSCGATGCQHTQISCDDGDVCTADSCDPELGCSNQPAPGAACDDGDGCTTADSCDAAGSCQPGSPLDVDDHNPCTADACDATLGVTHTALAGVACDDGNVCTSEDSCDPAGSCQGGATIAVDDGDPCTADACDPALGVSHVVAPGAACDDGNACSTADACAADGSCVGLPLPGLDDANSCTTDSCDPTTGAVTHTPIAVGASCSDGDPCNGEELCQGESQVTVTVEARATFLRYDHIDTPKPPVLVRLSQFGFGPGRRVRINTVGHFTAPNVTSVDCLFSSDDRVLGRLDSPRVPGAIQSEGPAIVTPKAAFDNVITDIPEDFVTDNSGVELTIPQGARYLLLGYFDKSYLDNSGMLQVVMRALEPECVAGEPPAVCE